MGDEEKASDPDEKPKPKTKGVMAVVRCNNFQCLAVRHSDGTWRDQRGNILEVVDVLLEL